jgi:two-component system nitrogen regulation sensor histidine kinase GlnL
MTVDCTVTPISEPQHKELLVELLHVDRHLRIIREENLLAQHQATRALARGLAHEIKNPLGGLRGAAQLLERELNNEALKEYTGIIIGEADRLQNLVNRMLGPNTLPQKRLINIHQVLEHVRSLVSAEAPPGVHIVRDYDPSIPELNADPDQLIQAVLNIVRNAVQAVGDHGEITLRTRTLRQYTIGQRRHKLVIRIDVIDNGPGIPPDMMESIFYPMVTGRPEGTGLGLPIAQFLISQHGGLIECASRPGFTTFTLLLPLESDDEC